MQPDFDKSAAAMVAGTQKAITAAVAPLLKRIEALEARPLPEKGDKGDRGEPGEPGRDGVGIRDGFLQREGVLILSLSDGTTCDLGEVVGKDGKDGIDGKDGVDGVDGKDGQSAPEPDPGMPEDEAANFAAMFLQRELGTRPIIELPPMAVPQSSTPPISVNIENHMPKSGGIEKTIVTKHDERGRILEFERHSV